MREASGQDAEVGQGVSDYVLECVCGDPTLVSKIYQTLVESDRVRPCTSFHLSPNTIKCCTYASLCHTCAYPLPKLTYISHASN